MVLISKSTFKRTIKNKPSIHKTVQGTYSIFNENGKSYLQVDTFGSTDREIPNKISQSIQMDEETLEFLLSLLR